MAIQTEGTETILSAKDATGQEQPDRRRSDHSRLCKEKIKAERSKLRGPEGRRPGTLLDEIKQREAEQLSRESDRARYARVPRAAERGPVSRYAVHRSGPAQQPGGDSPRGAGRARAVRSLGLGRFLGAGPLPSSLSAPERAEIAEAATTLLLMLAEAEPTPEAGLRRLDQAARSRPPTRAYHLRRAACLARAGERGGSRRRNAVSRISFNRRRRSTISWSGKSAYKREDSIAALRHFDQAIQLRTRPVLGPAPCRPCAGCSSSGPCRPRPA